MDRRHQDRSRALTGPRPAARGTVRRTRVGRAAAAAAALALLAAGCGDDVTAGPASSSPVAASSPVSDATAATGAPTTDPSATGSTTEDRGTTDPMTTDGSASSAPTSEDGVDAAGEPLADVGTAPSEEAATGAGLSVVDVRTGRHEGFDRVVVELAGDPAGLPGWYAHYVDEPSQQGSGEPVAVEGERFLEVVVRGLGYPFDTGQEELVGSVDGQGTALVREVRAGGVFEGQAQVLVGLDAAADAPYRVTRLSDPPRVVVDVLG
ncbi:hypothetical protein [uncultured Pseudokineococcus sp.]|uniref:AMIN-like domain-containing (lipo)protein n=1 Tax=uncultured Pseudokineococcus sp. TaxID=1642928 RepID=UPI002635A2D8|nr:hypothetical protein [uncultured Pseudokineococcus sp.]